MKGLHKTETDATVLAAIDKAVKRIEDYLRLRNAVGYVFNGMSLASVLLIMSLGLAITFGLMGIINMAHGEMLMLGSYTAYVLQELFTSAFPQYLDYYFVVALPLSIVVVGCVGVLMERGMLRFLYGRPLESLFGNLGHWHDVTTRCPAVFWRSDQRQSADLVSRRLGNHARADFSL